MEPPRGHASDGSRSQNWSNETSARLSLSHGELGGRQDAFPAASKLKLEKLVISGANLKQGTTKEKSAESMSTEELVQLLKGGGSSGTDEDMPQSGVISDKNLEIITSRKDLSGEQAKPNPERGVGWEDVEDRSGMSLLGNVEKK